MKFALFKPRNFKKSGEIIATLGPLERDVMETVWRHHARDGEITVRDVHLAFNERLAYTTLMTTLDRLHKKGLLNRRKDGRAFLYSPRLSSAELDRGIAREVINTLLGRGADGVAPVLACIIDTVSEYDRATLDELDRLIKEKRRELRQED